MRRPHGHCKGTAAALQLRARYNPMLTRTASYRSMHNRIPPSPSDSSIMEMLPKDKSPTFNHTRKHLKFPVTSNAHPFLFTVMTLIAAAELGLTAFLISAGNEVGIWSSPNYKSLLILLCFEAAWTLLSTTGYMLWVLDGAVYQLANVASSVIWLLLTAILWGAAAGYIHSAHVSSNCPPLSRCRQSLTVEALGWTEFALCLITSIATAAWLWTGRRALKDRRTYV